MGNKTVKNWHAVVNFKNIVSMIDWAQNLKNGFVKSKLD